MRVVILLSIMILSSCLNEPEIYFCVYTGSQDLECIWTNDKPDFSRPLSVGDICTSPKNFGEVKKHHEALHRKINERTE